MTPVKTDKLSVLTHRDGGASYKKVPFGVIFGPAAECKRHCRFRLFPNFSETWPLSRSLSVADTFKCKWQRRF